MSRHLHSLPRYCCTAVAVGQQLLACWGTSRTKQQQGSTRVGESSLYRTSGLRLGQGRFLIVSHGQKLVWRNSHLPPLLIASESHAMYLVPPPPVQRPADLLLLAHHTPVPTIQCYEHAPTVSGGGPLTRSRAGGRDSYMYSHRCLDSKDPDLFTSPKTLAHTS